MKVPVLTSFGGYDLLPSDHPLYAGRPGTIGSRSGNFALQNADLLISVGSRNNIRQISYNWKAFARGAKKIVVDIDKAELKKPTVHPDLAIHADAGGFLEELLKQLKNNSLPSWKNWRQWCAKRRKRYPVVLNEYWHKERRVNPYCFMDTLTKALGDDALVVTGNGTASVALYQAGIVKKGQRVFWNSGCAAMGYDLPAAIGACIGGQRQVICLAGDGSLQMNIQELQTMAHHELPVKLFVLNNYGYLSIRQTQDSFFEGRHVACDPDSGVSFPDTIKVARAYGLATERILRHDAMERKIKRVLRSKGPVVCEVMLSSNLKFMPRSSSQKKSDGKIVSRPLEDMYPFLDREEFKENMLIPEWGGE